MRKILLKSNAAIQQLRKTVVFSLFFGMTFGANALTFTEGNLLFTTTGANTVSVEKNGSPTGDVIIPGSVTYQNVTYTVTSIANSGFSGSSNITSVTIPESISKISDNAFTSCNRLATINYNAISAGSFSSAAFPANITTITIGENVTSIPASAFASCTKLATLNFNATNLLTITPGTYPNSITTLNIGDNVTRIPENLAYILTRISTLTIPSLVTTIGDRAFYGCTGLSGSLALPTGLQQIGDFAFYGVKGISGNLVIPNGVTRIGNSAFQACSGFNGTITLPATSLTTIGNDAFSGCSGITGRLTIPGTVSIIGNSAFSGCSGILGDLILPTSLTSLGEYAFSGCSLLYAITIPEKLTAVPSTSFAGCSEITTLNYKATNIQTLEAGTFPSTISTLLIGDNVTTIPANLAYQCSNLKGNLIFPTKLEVIGENAFSGCTGYSSISIPENVETIGKNAFNGCTGVNTLNYQAKAMASIITGTFPSSITTLELGHNVTVIPANFMNNCSNLKGKLSLPTSLKILGENAFSGCTGLIGNIDIPSGVTKVGAKAFAGCIGFDGTINISSTVTSIGSGAFMGCSSLTGNGSIPSSLNTVPDSIYMGCTQLKGITLPSSITKIGVNPFAGCRNVIRLQVDALVPPALVSSSLNGLNKTTCLLYVPVNSLYEYQSTEQWENFRTVFENNETGINTAISGEIKVYPNPASSFLRVNLSSAQEQATLIIYTISGSKVYETRMNMKEMEINISGLTAGKYILKIISEKKQVNLTAGFLKQ